MHMSPSHIASAPRGSAAHEQPIRVIDDIDSEIQELRSRERERAAHETKERERLEKQLQHEAEERKKLENRLEIERAQEKSSLENRLEKERSLHLQQLKSDRAIHEQSLQQTQHQLDSVRAMMDRIQTDGMASFAKVKEAVLSFDDMVKSVRVRNLVTKF